MRGKGKSKQSRKTNKGICSDGKEDGILDCGYKAIEEKKR
jgi:hypothetical protein